MRGRTLVVAGLGLVAVLSGMGMVQRPQRFNPVIDLLAAKQPVFGLYAPANPRAGRGGAAANAAANAATAPVTPPKTPAELAQSAVAYTLGDLIFDGGMEGNFDNGYPRFVEFAKGMAAAGFVTKGPSGTASRMTHPLFVKTPGIAANPTLAAERIAKQLNAGAAGIVFVDVESADELKAGLAAMRFKSQGGTRPDAVGDAPALWGMSEKDYRAKADLWPLNPSGELVNWTIVESKEGIERVREIAAVKGIGALFPGAGTLRGVYTKVDANGQTVRDAEAWEAAIQKVLAACKEFSIPCGYPATEADIEMRMKQGFSVFIINWGDAGFRAVDIGRRVGARSAPN